MKKSVRRLLIALALSLACVFAAAFTGCAPNLQDGVYVGSYSYQSWGTNYGIKVYVTVEGGKIAAVEKAESDFVDVSSPRGDSWKEEDVANWNDNLGALLESYKGMTVKQVLKNKVHCDSSGAPDNSDYDDGLIISGATLGSGRLLLAVQNALLSRELKTAE